MPTFPPMPGPPTMPIIPWPIIVRVKDCPSGAYISGAKILAVNETDGGYEAPSRLSQSDGSLIVNCANMSNWQITDNDLIHIEVMKGHRNATLHEKISVATRAARFVAYPLLAELREELPGRIGIVGSTIVSRKIIGRNKV